MLFDINLSGPFFSEEDIPHGHEMPCRIYAPIPGDIVFFIPHRPNSIQRTIQDTQRELFGEHLSLLSHAAIVSKRENDEVLLQHIDEQGPGHFLPKWLSGKIQHCEVNMRNFEDDFDFFVIHPENIEDRKKILRQLNEYFNNRTSSYWSAIACMRATLVQYQAQHTPDDLNTSREFNHNSGRECCSTLVAACVKTVIDHTIDHTPQSLARHLVSHCNDENNAMTTHAGSYSNGKIIVDEGLTQVMTSQNEASSAKAVSLIQRSPRQNAFVTSLDNTAPTTQQKPSINPSLLLRFLNSSFGKRFILPMLCCFLATTGKPRKMEEARTPEANSRNQKEPVSHRLHTRLIL